MSAEEPDEKVWWKVAHTANGATSVTASLQEGNLSVKWTVKTFASTVTGSVGEAEKGARQAMADLKTALAALEAG